MLKQVLLAFACCAIATVQATLPCLGAPAYLDYSFAASPESCDAYVICMGGQEIHGHRCPDGFFFEPITQSCNLQVSCTDCSTFGVQNLPHPDSCEQFIECIMGTREFRTCPAGFLFDRTVGVCNQAHLVNCPGQPTDPSYPTEITPTPTYPDFTETPTYPTDITPTPDPFPTTTTSLPPPQLPICLPGGQVHHAHPTDCTRFFLCICVHPECVLWEQQCINAFHWNQRITQCDFPDNAGCLIRPTDAPPPPVDPPGGAPTDPPLFPPIPVRNIEKESLAFTDIRRFVVYLDGSKEEITDNY